jgi:Ca2+-binding EF-hand superfamily protein
MMKKRLIVGYLMTATLVMAYGCARRPVETRDQTFDAIDVNNDDMVSADEFSDHFFATYLVMLDTDTDGKISRSEWLDVEKADGSEELFSRMDANQDGSVTIAELSAPAENRSAVRHMFRTFDHDGDGMIELREVEKARGAVQNTKIHAKEE